MTLEERILKIAGRSKKGVLQKDLGKKLKIDSKKCSILLRKLESQGLIERTSESVNGVRTYRISLVPNVEYSSLLVGDMIAPCVGCTLECTPEDCKPIGEWIQSLVKHEFKR